jgi:hypothetical protein
MITLDQVKVVAWKHIHVKRMSNILITIPACVFFILTSSELKSAIDTTREINDTLTDSLAAWAGPPVLSSTAYTHFALLVCRVVSNMSLIGCTDQSSQLPGTSTRSVTSSFPPASYWGRSNMCRYVTPATCLYLTLQRIERVSEGLALCPVLSSR